MKIDYGMWWKVVFHSIRLIPYLRELRTTYDIKVASVAGASSYVKDKEELTAALKSKILELQKMLSHTHDQSKQLMKEMEVAATKSEEIINRKEEEEAAAVQYQQNVMQPQSYNPEPYSQGVVPQQQYTAPQQEQTQGDYNTLYISKGTSDNVVGEILYHKDVDTVEKLRQAIAMDCGIPPGFNMKINTSIIGPYVNGNELVSKFLQSGFPVIVVDPV